MSRRWRCGVCKRRTVLRDGDIEFDARPRYTCGHCGHSYTAGWYGHADDPEPSRRFDPLATPSTPESSHE